MYSTWLKASSQLSDCQSIINAQLLEMTEEWRQRVASHPGTNSSASTMIIVSFQLPIAQSPIYIQSEVHSSQAYSSIKSLSQRTTRPMTSVSIDEVDSSSIQLLTTSKLLWVLVYLSHLPFLSKNPKAVAFYVWPSNSRPIYFPTFARNSAKLHWWSQFFMKKWGGNKFGFKYIKRLFS